jgi:uncharacterized protein YjbJ (UPF0337 family)
MAGEKDKAQGSIKEGVGEMTGNERLKNEGRADKAKGSAKDAAHQVEEGAKGVRDSLKKDR